MTVIKLLRSWLEYPSVKVKTSKKEVELERQAQHTADESMNILHISKLDLIHVLPFPINKTSAKYCTGLYG